MLRSLPEKRVSITSPFLMLLIGNLINNLFFNTCQWILNKKRWIHSGTVLVVWYSLLRIETQVVGVINLLPSRAQTQRGIQHMVLWANIMTPEPYNSIQMQFKTLRLGFTNRLIAAYISVTERICDPKTGMAEPTVLSSGCHPRRMTGRYSSILPQHWARSFWDSSIQSLKTFPGLNT